MTIERAAVSDCRESARLLTQQLLEHHIPVTEKPLVEVLKQVVAQPERGFILVARQHGKLVGIAYVAMILSAEHCGPIGWLEELYVCPESREGGIGHALLQACLERARERGMRAVELEVDSTHRRAVSLYRRAGFRFLRRSRWVRHLNSTE